MLLEKLSLPEVMVEKVETSDFFFTCHPGHNFDSEICNQVGLVMHQLSPSSGCTQLKLSAMVVRHVECGGNRKPQN